MLQRKQAALFMIACAVALAHAIHFSHVCDDAFISFRYARNFARGFGLVFSPGERTMGYSDLLWVLLLAGFDRTGIEPPLAAKLLGTACAWGTLFVLQRHLVARHRSILVAAVALGMLATNGTFALWMFGGLEGHLFGLLMVYAVVTTLELERETDAPLQRWARVGVSLALGCMTRPEAILYAAPICFWVWLRARPRHWRPIAVVAGIAVATAALVMLWQWRHYGAPFPNTYYAKRLPLSWPLIQRGLRLTREFSDAYFGMPVWIVVGWLAFGRKAKDGTGWLPLLMIAAFVAFYLRIGGDQLVYYRMWLPTLPMFALLAADVVVAIGESSARWGKWLAPVLGIALVAIEIPTSVRGSDITYLRQDDANLKNLELVARTLKAMPKDTVLAANVVGILAYVSELRLIDMLGLNDAHIARSPKQIGIAAHESHDGAYVLSRKPDIIVPAFPMVYPDRLSLAQMTAQGYPSDRDLWRQPALFTHYMMINLSIAGRGFLPVFVRKDYAALQELQRAFLPDTSHH